MPVLIFTSIYYLTLKSNVTLETNFLKYSNRRVFVSQIRLVGESGKIFRKALAFSLIWNDTVIKIAWPSMPLCHWPEDSLRAWKEATGLQALFGYIQ